MLNCIYYWPSTNSVFLGTVCECNISELPRLMSGSCNKEVYGPSQLHIDFISLSAHTVSGSFVTSAISNDNGVLFHSYWNAIRFF